MKTLGFVGHLPQWAPAAQGAIARTSKSLMRDKSGSVTTIAAFAFPMLIGGMGLGAEVGHWYLVERKLQHAADLSAHAAALRLAKDGEEAALDSVALHVATQSGFPEEGGEIVVHHPPVSGPNAGDDDMVEVVLTQDIERLFSGFFLSDEVGVHGRAVAGIVPAPHPACMIALAPADSETLSVTGNGSITLSGCVAAANSTDMQGMFVKGSGTFAGKCAYTGSGSAYGQKTDSIVSECDPEVQANTAADPYGGLMPPAAAPCYAPGKKDPAIPATPMREEEGVNIWDLCELNITSDLVLEPGLYIIYGGDITDTGQHKLTGTGVTFYLTSASGTPTDHARINVNGAKLNLTAPTTGPYSGLIFFAEAENTAVQNFGGNSTLQAQGAVRFPGATVHFGGGSYSGGCVQIVADKISFTGNGSISFGHNCASAGTTTEALGASATAKLLE